MSGRARPPSHPSPLTLGISLAALGAVVGFVLAGIQIAQQQYIAQGLLRTALWVATQHTLVPTLCGAAAGVVLAFAVARWAALLSALQKAAGLAPLRQAQPLSSGPTVFRFVLFVALCSAGAALLVPMQGPVRLHLPYLFVAVAAFAALWLFIGLLAAAALPALSRDDQPAVWFRLHWLALVGLAYLVIFLRAWARDDALLAGGGLLVCVAAYHALHLPLRRLTDLAASACRRAARILSILGRVLALAVLGFAVLVWAGGWVAGARVRSQARQRGLNLVLIGVDTLRYDHLSLLSPDEHERDLTPNLRTKLAARGTVWTGAISQAPWTLPTIASIFTGLYPEQHGAALIATQLRPSQTTFPELLRNAGYRTMGVVSSLNASSYVAMDQGFLDFRECGAMDNFSVTSAEVTDGALRFLEAHGREPFFLFAYYFDPHHMYHDHSEFDFADGYDGWFLPQTQSQNQIILFRQKRDLLGPREHALARDLYDEEVAYTDHHVGRLLDYLDRTGLWENTVVIFFADHGEEFFDHGWIGHCVSLYQELVHVPLVTVVPPGTKHAVVDQLIETRWLFDTILQVLDVDPPAGREPNPSLLAGPVPKRDFMRSSTRYVLSEEQNQGIHPNRHILLSGLVGKRWKVIEDHTAHQVKLFDLQQDPLETHDLASDLPEVRDQLVRALRARNAEVLQNASAEPSPRVTDEAVRRLKSLGYL